MIIQCQTCQTRFRLADDKIKPGGTRVRCSKCKEIFTVMPPEPEPAAEAVTPATDSAATGLDQAPAQATPPQDSPPRIDDSRLAEGDPAREHASEVPAATDEATATADIDVSSFGDHQGEPGDKEAPVGEVPFDDDARDAAGVDPLAFDFSEEPDTAGPLESDQTAAAAADMTDSDTFVFPSPDEEEAEESGFRFEDENPFGEDIGSEWDDDASTVTPFDFNEPEFETDRPDAWNPPEKGEGEGLQFGEITFSDDDDAKATPG